MICSKCQLDKDEKEYQTYWHSLHQKHYRRRECSKCFYSQRKERKQARIAAMHPDTLYKDNPNYRKCKKCGEWNTADKYMTKSLKHKYANCPTCRLILTRLENVKIMEQSFGGAAIKTKPNEYYNDIQKNAVFNIMKAFNWTYNENGVWSKEGIKDKDNNWCKLNTKRKTSRKVTEEDIERMIRLRRQGRTYLDISIDTKFSDTTVFDVLKKYYNK
jgi:hypothetical protein